MQFSKLNMIKLIIFDWGGVCGLYNLEIFNTFIKKKGYNLSSVDTYFKEFKPKFDRNQISEEEFWSELAQKIGFKEHWSILAQRNKKNLIVNRQLMDYIKNLKKNVKVVLLSNMDKTSIKAINKEVKLTNYFEKVYFSSKYKLGKLEKELISNIINDFNIKPKEMLFIDDFLGNINKAKAYGMQTILFIGLGDLRQKVSKLLKH